MLHRLVRHERRRALDSILQYYREQYHPNAILVPSGRFGLYAVAKEMLSRGDRALVSPITCRTVIEALLAAGVTPVFVDIQLESGNIDVTRLSTGTLNAARAIITTNLYGNPDAALELRKIAKARNLLLIEDCAHILSTSVEGRQIGGIGDVSVFSFKKYFDEPGGVVSVRDRDAAGAIRARVAAEVADPSVVEDELRYAQFAIGQVMSASMVRRLSSTFRGFSATFDGAGKNSSKLPGAERPVHPAEPSFPVTASLLRVAGFLGRCDSIITDRLTAAAELIELCPLSPKMASRGVCYLVVPFSAPNRDKIVGALRERGIPTYFLYTPPMNVLFQDRLPPCDSLDVDVVDEWCRTILPIDPRLGRSCVEVISSLN